MAVEAELKVGRGGGEGGQVCAQPIPAQENGESFFTYYLLQEETRNKCLVLHNKFFPVKSFCVAEFIDPEWEDKINSSIGLSYRPARRHRTAGRYDNPMPELTLSPSPGSMNSKSKSLNIGKHLMTELHCRKTWYICILLGRTVLEWMTAYRIGMDDCVLMDDCVF